VNLDRTINYGAGPGRYFFDDLITISSATASVGTQLTKVTSSDSRVNRTYGFNAARCPIAQGPGECTAQ